jgi:hypothetical protein
MNRQIRVSRTENGVLVNDKHIYGAGVLQPDNLLDYYERKALALFMLRKEKIQSSIITL